MRFGGNFCNLQWILSALIASIMFFKVSNWHHKYHSVLPLIFVQVPKHVGGIFVEFFLNFLLSNSFFVVWKELQRKMSSSNRSQRSVFGEYLMQKRCLMRRMWQRISNSGRFECIRYLKFSGLNSLLFSWKHSIWFDRRATNRDFPRSWSSG